MTMSISPASIRATNSAALAGDQIVSEVTIARARVGEQRGDLVGDPLDPGAAGDQAVLLAGIRGRRAAAASHGRNGGRRGG